MSKEKYDLKRFLTDNYKNNDTWKDFADTASDVIYDRVYSKAEQIAKLKDSRTISREQLIANTKQLGFLFQSEFYSTDEYKRLNDYIGLYQPQSGTDRFIDFLGYIQNTLFNLNYLWTEDYEEFVTQDQVATNASVLDGGTFYPTSHVEVEYSANRFETAEAENNLIELFYQLAPIHLVLHRITSFYESEDTQYLGYMALVESVKETSHTETFFYR